MKHTYDTVKDSINTFIKTHGREPLPREFTKENNLPNRRYIERVFGGLPALRKSIGLLVEEYNKGPVRSKTAQESMLRSKSYEVALYHKIRDKYHDSHTFKKVVHREFCYQQYVEDGNYTANIRTDVVIVDREKDHYTFIDFFFPSDEYSYYGCVASKTRKLRKSPVSLGDKSTHEILFVCTNPKFNKSYKAELAEVLSYSDFLTRFSLQ